MKHLSYFLLLFFVAQSVKAQLPEDALRMSWNVPSGTARQQAIGGAMGSLGGEITSLFVNPAGLGFYKTSEFVMTPGISLAKSKSTYRDSDASSDLQSRFNLGTTGFVIGSNYPNGKWTSKSFAIGVNRIANFNSSILYKGNNNFSSYSEQFAEEFSQSGLDIGDNLGSLSLGTQLAVESYLIDTMSGQVIGLPEFVNAVNQENKITSRGGITEIAIGFASNMEDKVYIGGSLGVPILNYSRTTEFLETDASTDNDNNFNYSRYIEDFTSRGVGVNAKLGVIFKPVPAWRVGIALHTPTLYGIRDKLTATMTTDVENYVGLNYGPIDAYTNDPPTYKYDLISPWRFMVSGAFVFSEVAEVKQQRGFITADIEYVTYGSSRFSSADEYTDESYFDDVNRVVKDAYKGAFNFKVGGELKFNTLMTRLGFNYFGNPYKDNELSGNKMNLSGGLGYRNKGIFVDLTYVQSLSKDIHFPYRLSDKANTFAEIRDRTGGIVLTFGVKI